MKKKPLFLLILITGIAILAGPTATVQAFPTISNIDVYIGDSEADIITVMPPRIVSRAPNGKRAVLSTDSGRTTIHGTPLDATTAMTTDIQVGKIIAVAVTFDAAVERLDTDMRIKFGSSIDSSIRIAHQPYWPGTEFGIYDLQPDGSIGNEIPSDTTEEYDHNVAVDDLEWTTLFFLYEVKEGDIGPISFAYDNPLQIESSAAAQGGYSYGAIGFSDEARGPAIAALTYSGTVHWPRNSAPELAAENPIRITPAATHTGTSLWHTVRRTGPTHGNYSLQSNENAGKQVSYYGLGDTISFHLTFSERVKARQDTKLFLNFDGYTRTGTIFDPSSNPETSTLFATLRRGSGDGTSDTLIFDYTVQEHDDTHDLGIALNHWGLQATDAQNRPLNPAEAITDLVGNPFDLQTDIRSKLQEYYEWDNPQIAYGPANYTTNYKGTNFLIDTHRPSVRLTGLITDETHDAQGRRTAHVNFEDRVGTRDTSGEGIAPDTDVAETAVQTGAFEVDMRFFNYGTGDGDGVLADDPQGFTAEDIHITDTSGTSPPVRLNDWQVSAPVLIGLDHRDPGYYGDMASDRDLNNAKMSAAFMVYKTTITPAIGFSGDVTIQIPENVLQDIAGNGNYASNTLTVPVNNPLRVAETPEIVVPETGAYAVGDKIEIEVTYNRENLRYIGENPPYLTVYLGEEVAANARHATWEGAEDANSTKVTFAYEVAASDVAASVKVAPVGMTVPTGTTLLDDSGQQLQGKSEPANPSGEGLETMPPQGQGQLQLGASDEGLAPRTEVPINLYPFFEETEPKSAATDVPRSPIVFNELGNGSGDANDWLEFRNVTGSAVSLKEWELSVVQDGKKEDTSLIVFPDVSVPANELLLITNSDPTADGNLLAGGDDIATAKVETEGSSHLYLVQSGLSLPDDGKFLLILRKAKEKLGLDEAFVDVAGGGGSGTDAFIRETTGDYDTHVWPLQVLQTPGGDTEEALGSGKVWQRAKADIVGYHKDAWAEAAFTGLGYDRKVSASAATAGTPGYPNVAAKEAAAKGSVTFSEIMVDSAGGTLPQWIELYNTSKTEVLNLNRWELEIQNVDSEDLVGRPIVTLTLQEKLLQPNQTVLIVAGPARASSGSSLPADRIYNLLALHDKNLRIKKPQDTFLSAEGFYLKLTDRNGQLVDEIGNTDGDRRTTDAPKWLLAMSAEEGVRSSLIRRYTDGTSEAKDGTEKAGWVLAANVKKVVDGALHWGSAEDIGTPGYRKGGALPVELSSFTVTRTESGSVVVTWTTESEVDNAGFNLRRSEKRESGFTLINPALIAGAGTTGERQTYTFTDASAKPGVAYYYQIEEVAFDGKRETLGARRLRGPVSAANRMLTTFGAVKQREE